MRARIVGAASTFALAVVFDALIASQSGEHSDVPASLRGTCIVFVIAVASPILVNSNSGFVGIYQKHIFGTLLLLASMVGMHTGSQWLRFFDALFVALVSAGAISLFSSSGVDVTSKKMVNNLPALVQKSAIAIAAGFLLYTGFRILRVALVSPHRAAHLELVVGGNTTLPTTVRGYGCESDAATVLIAFGGAVAIGMGILLYAREDDFRVCGISTLGTQVSAAAAYTGLAGFAALLYVGDQISEMQVVFHKNACFGEGCDVAAETRRAALQTASTGCSLLFVCAGLVTLNQGMRNDTFVNVAFVIGLFATLLRVDFEGVGAYADAISIFVVLSCWAAVCYHPRLGAFVGFLVFAIELAISSAHYGADVIFAHISNVTLVSATVAGLLAASLGGLGDLCKSKWLLYAEAFLAATAHATALAFFFGSAGLIGSYVGGHFAFDEPALPPRREALLFAVKHFLPLVLSTALYQPTMRLPQRTHWVAWWLPVVIPVIYTISMALQERVTPALSPVDLAQFALVLFVALPIWVLAGMRSTLEI